ncbi:MAG: division/cell wall cluster transcriptional repressor MraZ [Bacteroidales bacterium]|nr:division/cell wall cluster transcriptional repressor MraZ [Bacteroidales bacterium]MDD3430964.1 division/cell wall cluster transcriptional repressor MraZ [Bacteroidales bacterium]MDD4362175.1 division/cell wall cluster transcriptional repressor MraZ [Bacteroidales bacterium]MDD4430940.1 division/cell wall cluster transcriptional repressor MraZ [Bacteroidales bacterium]
MRFLGNIEAKLDAKNRVFVPAAFRKVLDNGFFAQTENGSQNKLLYLRKDVYQNCIVVYPATVWEEELSELRTRLNKWNPEEQELYRQFMLEAETVEMDPNGRILIPKRLLLKTGIEKALRFLGVDNTMEIWAKEALEQPRLEPELFKTRLQELMTKTKTPE